MRLDLATAYIRLGGALGGLARYEEAIYAFDRAFQQEADRREPEVRQTLGNAHLGRGLAQANLQFYDGAVGSYDHAIRLYDMLDQDQSAVRQSLGLAHLERGKALANFQRFNEALGAYDHAIGLYDTLDQDRPTLRESLGNAHFNRGLALYWMGRLTAAFGALDHAITLGNGNAQGLRNSPWRLWSAEGLSKPPETFAGTLPDAANVDWEPAPLIGGDWIALTGESARPHLDALWSLLGPLGPADLRDCIAAGVGALRRRSLARYPGWTLCETRVFGDRGPGAVAFLSGVDGAVVLSGTSKTVHAYNKAIRLRLSGTAEYLDYLSYFCGSIRAEGGRFQVVEATEQVPWRTDADPARVAEVQARLERPRVVALSEDSAELTTCVLFGGALFRSNFKIQAHGMVDMTSDELLADAPLAQIERFDGPIRLPPVKAPPDPQQGSA